MAEPAIGDYFIVGGCGAYCASMSPGNYNSHTLAAEVMKMPNGTVKIIRRRQTLEELTANEIPL
jgi:diaminopimelate decarboxylase